MATFGRAILESTGRTIQVTADGRPEAKHVGVTIDWTTVAAVAGSDVVLLDGVTVRVGEQYLRYGQVITQITASGKYGPFDPAAADGRQTLTRDKAFILNQTIKFDELASDHPEAIMGGLCFQNRIIQAGTGVASLAAGPQLAALQTAFPRLALVTE